MDKDSRRFLDELMAARCPSGFETPAQDVVERRMIKSADSVRRDVHGNLIGALNEEAPLRVMLAGHVDEIGLMVSYIDDQGYIYFRRIGGVDPAVLPGQRVLVHSEKGDVPGAIGRKAIHLMKPEDRKKLPQLKDMWIDIGAKDKKDAEKLLAVGDAVTIEQGLTELRNGIAVARGFDDRVGSFVVAETLRLLSKKKPKVALFAVSTVQEELGLRGARTSAFGVDPQVGIAVDVGFASDHPGAEKKEVGDIRLGKGPILHKGANINPVVGKGLVQVARKKKIPWQMQAEPGATGTDANAIQITRAGVAAALVSIPCRYMHTPSEAVSLADLEAAARLLSEYVMTLSPKTSFIPG